MTSYRLARTEDLRTVKALHVLCLPSDEYDLSGQLWLVRDEKGTPVAFCSCRKVKDESTVFFSRAGVLPCARGHGLQRRMIHARLRWAKEIGAKKAVSYTSYDNHSSIVNLLKSGFRFFVPAWKWAGNSHYFVKDLK